MSVRTVVGILTSLGVLAASSVLVGGSAGSSSVECNGSAELCERTLGDVAFATSHNSMSSSAEGFRGPNQGATVSEQLEAGIRGFQIDAYAGVDGGSGVYTDLDGVVRAKAIDLPRPLLTVGRQLHRQLGAPPAGTPTEVYLCHTFCEIGATPMRAFADDLRTFLDDHLSEVIVAVIEDYVPPEDLAAVFDAAGLGSELLAVEPGAPLPTLGEMIASGHRMLVTLENADGGPTLPHAFSGLVEETPFTFARGGRLRSSASCAPNRGSDDSPVFQLNHWVTPARRHGAQAVNADVLWDRVDRCMQRRGRIPTLVAVDFAEISDVVDVVDAINAGTPRRGRASTSQEPTD